MNTLFIGIYDSNEPNTAFRQAFKSAAKEYKEISINHNNKLNRDIIAALKSWRVDLIFMQLQAPGLINHDGLNVMKRSGAYIVQWTGDARQPLPRHYIDFGRQIDLSLFTNQNDVDSMLSVGVNADMLQVAVDHNIYTNTGPTRSTAPVIFMGNNYDNMFALSRYRYSTVKQLREQYGSKFRLYGTNWPKQWGIESLMYKQQVEAEVYRSCKIGINISHYDLKRYSSDRMFRIMGSGALCISKEFPDMDEYRDKLVTYNGEFKDLRNKINYYLHNEGERVRIAQNGCEYVHSTCTWDHRIKELLILIDKWKTLAA